MGMGVEKWEMRSGNIQFVILSGVEGGNGQKNTINLQASVGKLTQSSFNCN